MPPIVTGPDAPKGTSTFTTSGVFENIAPPPPPVNVTATLDVSNLRSVVELIVRVSPPLRVVAENAPPKACGRTATLTESLMPPPATLTHDGAAVSAVTMTCADVFGMG